MTVSGNKGSKPLKQKLKILKLENLISLKTAEITFGFENCCIEKIFSLLLFPTSHVYDRSTRFKESNLLYLSSY